MKIKQPPLLVALDTQVFYSYNFNYNSKVFRSLVTLIQQERIKLLLTSVTLDEIKAHITEGSELTSRAIRQAIKDLNNNLFNPPRETKKVKIAENSDLLSEFKEKIKNIAPEPEQIKQELLGKFEDFLQEADFEIIEVDRVSIVDIFEKYFSGSPPFGEGKKKSEFPDAFALLALQKEAEYKNQKIYVVSGDCDWERFCSSSEYLLLVKKIDELLEIINRETDSDEVDVYYNIYKGKEDEIKEKIEEEFSELNFSIDSRTDVIEWGSEEVEIEVNSVDITDSSLVSIDDYDADELSVIFKLVADVNYEAKVSYKSLEFAIYDREDDTYYGGETIEDLVFHKYIKVNVEVTLVLSRDKKDSLCDAEIDDITIYTNNTLGEIIIYIGLDEDYYY